MGLFWDFVISMSCDPGRPRELTEKRMADFRHLFPVDDPDVTWYDCNHLQLQVEREGSMD